MIFVTGDMHGDKTRFQAVRKAGVKKGDSLFILGDFGFVWNGGEKEEKILNWIGRKKYQVLVIDGCNENHEKLFSYQEVELFAGKAYHISGNLYLLKRGEIYEIEGKKIFVMGGGSSLERFSNPEENEFLFPSAEEFAAAREKLLKANNEVDYILTHEAPEKLWLALAEEGRREATILHRFLEDIRKEVRFQHWYFGKYHFNRLIPPHYTILFTEVHSMKESGSHQFE